MTTEIEKQFFDTFGIKPKLNRPCEHLLQNKYCDEDKPCRDTYFEPFPYCVGIDYCKKDYKFQKWEYPQITDRKLLELICIDFNENPYKCRGGESSVDEIKERVLSDFIHEFENDLFRDKEEIKYQVQELFKED